MPPRVVKVVPEPLADDGCTYPPSTLPEREEVMGHPYTPERLLRWGTARVNAFTRANSLVPMPIISCEWDRWHFDACAYWRPNDCHICLKNCARPASETQVRNWNWPGCVTDRTPYGVVCHELGHHCDYHIGKRLKLKVSKYSSEYSSKLRKFTRDKPITSYCPNDAEWFAECMRLFITNHALLCTIRPNTWSELMEHFVPVSDIDWHVATGKGCPARILRVQEKR